MSFTLHRHMLEIPNLTDREFRILFCYAHHADNATFLAWPSVKTVARECQCSPRSVQYTINKLLAREDNIFFTSNRSKGRSSTTYQMFFPGMEKVEKQKSTVISFEKKRRERGPSTKKLAAELQKTNHRVDTLFQEAQG